MRLMFLGRIPVQRLGECKRRSGCKESQKVWWQSSRTHTSFRILISLTTTHSNRSTKHLIKATPMSNGKERVEWYRVKQSVESCFLLFLFVLRQPLPCLAEVKSSVQCLKVGSVMARWRQICVRVQCLRYQELT